MSRPSENEVAQRRRRLRKDQLTAEEMGTSVSVDSWQDSYCKNLWHIANNIPTSINVTIRTSFQKIQSSAL